MTAAGMRVTVMIANFITAIYMIANLWPPPSSSPLPCPPPLYSPSQCPPPLCPPPSWSPNYGKSKIHNNEKNSNLNNITVWIGMPHCINFNKNLQWFSFSYAFEISRAVRKTELSYLLKYSCSFKHASKVLYHNHYPL